MLTKSENNSSFTIVLITETSSLIYNSNFQIMNTEDIRVCSWSCYQHKETVKRN